MKTNVLTAPRISKEDSEFLSTIQNNRLTINQMLMAAPARLLTAPIAEVTLPVRFESKVKEARTLADLLRFNVDGMQGRNLGKRTLEVVTENLKSYFVKKINSKPLVTLREMMQDFGNELMAREARIWEMRMGMNGQHFTLESVGQQFGLTRERVRQIESAMFTVFAKKYPAVTSIRANVTDGMTITKFVELTGELVGANDLLPLEGILSNLNPRMYVVVQEGIEPIISVSPSTELVVSYKRSLNGAEDIFRASDVLLSREQMISALNNADMDDISRNMAISKLDNEGIWIEGKLLSPNRDKTNVAIGCIQASNHPLHLEELAEDIKEFCNEETSVESLRAALSLVSSVRSFGYGTVGFARHVNSAISENQAQDVIAFCDGVIARGKEGFQWNTKDLLARVQKKYPNLTISHHELNVILHDSKRLTYLGRLTWVLNGESEQRKLYRELFISVLTKAGKPLAEDILLERVKKERSLHLNVHLRNDTFLLEVSPKVWGLTDRDNPFSTREVNKMAKLFDNTFHNGKDFDNDYLDKNKIDRKGIRASEIMKVIEIKG